MKMTNPSQKQRTMTDGESCDSDHAADLETRFGEIVIASRDDFVESFDRLVDPRRHHADQPVVIVTGKTSKHQRRKAEGRIGGKTGRVGGGGSSRSANPFATAARLKRER